MSLIYQSDTFVGGRRPGLYLGGKTDAKDAEKLERWNVTHILNVTPSKEACITVSGTCTSFVLDTHFHTAFAHLLIALFQ